MENTEKTNGSKAKKIMGTIGNVLLWIFLVFAFLMMVFAFASTGNDYSVPIMGNKIIMNVVSPSMEPTIMKGDLIVGTVLTDEEKSSLKEGDIITFFVDLDGDGAKELNTHRIKTVNYGGDPEAFRTQGDNNNNVEDNYTVRLNDIVAIWREGDTQMHGIGNVFAFLQSRLGFMLIVVVPLALFFVYEVVRLIFIIYRVKNGDKRSITAEDEEEIKRRAVEEYLRSQGIDPAAATKPAEAASNEISEAETEEE